MTKTPRTDAILRGDWISYGKLARELELENAALKEALERRHAEQSYPMPNYVSDALKAKGGMP